jgi:arabinosaccharide transport system permease protein
MGFSVWKGWTPMSRSRKLTPFLFLAPFLLLFAVYRLWPILSAFLLSLQDVKGLGDNVFIGIQNYLDLIADKSFLSSLKITSYFTVGANLLLIPIPLILAVLLFNRNTPLTNAWRTILFLPSLTSLVVVGTVFRIILADYAGLLNTFLGFFGIKPISWLLSTSLTVPSLVILAFWRWTGMFIIYFISGLTTIPTEIYESARIDGASGTRMFFRITVPMIRPIIIFVLSISVIGAFQVFVEPYILYGAGRTPGESGLTTVLYLYRRAFRNFDMGYASAIGVVLAIIILLVSIAFLKLVGFFRKSE